MQRFPVALGAMSVAMLWAAAAQAQMINQGVPGNSAAREARLAPMREAAARMNQFETTRRLAEHSPAEYQRLQRRAAELLEATHTSCDVVNAAELGMTERRRDILEVACSSGFGYILVGSSPPAAYDCWQLAQAAQAVRASNPRADVGSQCALRENGGA